MSLKIDILISTYSYTIEKISKKMIIKNFLFFSIYMEKYSMNSIQYKNGALILEYRDGLKYDPRNRYINKHLFVYHRENLRKDISKELFILFYIWRNIMNSIKYYNEMLILEKNNELNKSPTFIYINESLFMYHRNNPRRVMSKERFALYYIYKNSKL